MEKQEVTASGRLIIKPFYVDVAGFGRYRYPARSRGMALSKAFGDFGTLDNGTTFGQFLKIAKVSPIDDPGERFGEAITVGGQPAFYVSHDRQYIQFVRPDSDVILNSHPYDVEPPHARRGTPYYEEPRP